MLHYLERALVPRKNAITVARGDRWPITYAHHIPAQRGSPGTVVTMIGTKYMAYFMIDKFPIIGPHDGCVPICNATDFQMRQVSICRQADHHIKAMIVVGGVGTVDYRFPSLWQTKYRTNKGDKI